MRSMTGFGRGEAETDGNKVTLEMKTVNHRFLDINIRIPRALGFAEEYIRKTIKESLSRGRVDVFVNYSAAQNEGKPVYPDNGLIKSYLKAFSQVAETYNIENNIKLSDMLSISDAFIIDEEPGDEEKQNSLVRNALETALSMLIDMREREGAGLSLNIKECLESLDSISNQISERKSCVPKEYAEKLKLRIGELLNGNEIDETRFNAEVAYMADRMDITEEIVRLKTHIKQFKSAVSDQSIVGRKLDFMVQEMNRELNTIGSKSQDMSITNAVIEGKSIVEKIREQVQNIE